MTLGRTSGRIQRRCSASCAWGRTANAPVVAAGIIRVHLLDFLRQLTTIRISGGTHKENAQGAARFGRFFFGALWNTYVRHAAAAF